MMDFYEADSILQILFLIFSQFTVILLASGIIFLHNRKAKLFKQAALFIIFLINLVLYVLMQLGNRLVFPDRNIRIDIPYIWIMVTVCISVVILISLILNETKNRKTISHRSIKESFDNLPSGVCYFNEAGLPVLCNRAMHRFSFAVCGKDVQYITDLENDLAKDFISSAGVSKDGNVFILPDRKAWKIEKRSIADEKGNIYTQYVATDVTDLNRNREELMKENEQLRKVRAELKKLSANVVEVTREEEILNTKMRVHDEMGRCLIEAQKYLQEDREDSIPDSFALLWKRAVSMVKYNNDIPNEDMLSQIRKACESMRLAFIQNGNLPKQEKIAYIFTCAIRECVTNAVRYAKANNLYATFAENENEFTVTVTNDGIKPEKERVEGGGLSTLRRRVERIGGFMRIDSKPQFVLTVTVPKEKEGII